MIDIAPAPRKSLLPYATKCPGRTCLMLMSRSGERALELAEAQDGHGLPVRHRRERDPAITLEIVEHGRAERHLPELARRIDVREHGLHRAHSHLLELRPDVALAHGFQDA